MCKLDAGGGISYPEIADDPVAWQDLLGGYMELFPLPFPLASLGLWGVCDEEGWLKPLEPNVYSALLGRKLAGPVVIARVEPPEFVDLTERDIAALDEWFGHTFVVVL